MFEALINAVIQDGATLLMVVSMVLGLGVMFLVLMATLERVCRGEHSMLTTIILRVNTVLAWLGLQLVRSTWQTHGEASEAAEED